MFVVSLGFRVEGLGLDLCLWCRVGALGLGLAVFRLAGEYSARVEPQGSKGPNNQVLGFRIVGM